MPAWTLAVILSAAADDDPWRWLEDPSPATALWLAEQAAITRTHLAELDLASAHQRVREAMQDGADRTLAHARGQTLVWRLQDTDGPVPLSRFELSWNDGPPTPALRPDGSRWSGELCALSLSPSGRRLVLGGWTPGPPDQRTCALTALADDGRAWPVLAPGHPVYVSWEDEERLFISDRVEEHHHRLLRVPLDGSAHEELERTTWPAWAMEVGDELLVVQQGPSFDLPSRGEPGHLRPVRAGALPAVRVIGVHDDEVLLLAGPEDARQLLAVNGEGDRRTIPPPWPTWRVASAWRHGEGLLVVYTFRARLSVVWRPFEGSPQALPLPPGARVKAWPGRTHVAALEVAHPGGSQLFHLDPDLQLTSIPYERPIGRFLVVDTPAEGGTLPVSLWLPEDRSDVPLWAHVYGGFRSALQVAAGPAERAWVERGGGVAWLHVRGGSELGDPGDLHGPEARPLIYGDVVHAITGLHAAGIGVPGRVVLSGFSNGGLTALGAAFLAPQRFAAVIAGSGPYDLVQGERFPGWWWPDEYGRMRRPAQRAAILAAAPLLHVPADCPPILLHTGQADLVVPPAHAYKATAALRAADQPVWLRVWPWTTHAYVSGRVETTSLDTHRESASELLAFAAQAVGLELGAPPAAPPRVRPPTGGDPR